MATLVKDPDTKFSTPVYAVVAHASDMPGTALEPYDRVDGFRVLNIYVNNMDAEAALNEFNLQSLESHSFERDYYQSDEFLPGTMTDEEFCALANNRFGHIFTMKPATLLSDLDMLVSKLNNNNKLDLLKMLCFSFGKVVGTNVVME
jgi:hypothetical protein